MEVKFSGNKITQKYLQADSKMNLFSNNVCFKCE